MQFPPARQLTVAAVALLTVPALLNSLLRGRVAAWLAVLIAIAACWALARSSPILPGLLGRAPR